MATLISEEKNKHCSRRKSRVIHFHFSSLSFLIVYLPVSSMSILSYNGGAVIAMKGKECVAVASDLR